MFVKYFQIFRWRIEMQIIILSVFQTPILWIPFLMIQIKQNLKYMETTRQ